eukprot:TRINITY_DN45250_c0_g1_i5.p2 TRINITY_DN45250_c0_g1~~TRINITY_DN45250_c0_g1_i5.p2  ORF type:complete len:141 (+),score=23.23 TRINITY_DN45250_c0_g1_i5:351-773(+)
MVRNGVAGHSPPSIQQPGGVAASGHDSMLMRQLLVEVAQLLHAEEEAAQQFRGEADLFARTRKTDEEASEAPSWARLARSLLRYRRQALLHQGRILLRRDRSLPHTPLPQPEAELLFCMFSLDGRLAEIFPSLYAQSFPR